MIVTSQEELYKKVKQSRYRPGEAQRVPGINAPRFRDKGTEWW